MKKMVNVNFVHCLREVEEEGENLIQWPRALCSFINEWKFWSSLTWTLPVAWLWLHGGDPWLPDHSGRNGICETGRGGRELSAVPACPMLVIKQAVAYTEVVISRTRSTAYFSQHDRNRVDLNKIPALSSCYLLSSNFRIAVIKLRKKLFIPMEGKLLEAQAGEEE